MLQQLIEAMTAEMEQNGENAYVLRERGRLKMMSGDHAGAMADLKRAAELEPSIVDGITGRFDNKK